MEDTLKEKMVDLGEEYPQSECGCDDCKKSNEEKKGKKHYPRESFTTDQLPSLEGAQVGDTVNLVVKAVVCGVRSGSEYDYGIIGPGGIEEENKTKVTLKLLKAKATVYSQDDEDISEMKTSKKSYMDRLTEE